jgi:hypothetical protein
MSKQIDINRNAARRIVSIRTHPADDRKVQSRAQANLRSAFPYDDPPPLPGDVEEARERLRHDQESGLHVFGWVLVCAAVTALVVVCYVVWRVHG